MLLNILLIIGISAVVFVLNVMVSSNGDSKEKREIEWEAKNTSGR